MKRHARMYVAGVVALLSACGSLQRTTQPLSLPPVTGAPVAERPPRNWHLLDLSLDHMPGISAERAYRELLKDKRPRRTVVVAVIDLGVDTAHPALRPVIWNNSREIAGNKIDDDHNGYVDDVQGWNFLGGLDGRNVEYSTYEVARLYGQCTNSSARSPRVFAKPPKCEAIIKDYTSQKNGANKWLAELNAYIDTLRIATNVLVGAVGKDSLTRADVIALKSDNPSVEQARQIWVRYIDEGSTAAAMADWKREAEIGARFLLDPNFDPSDIVGDHPDDPWERYYGNADVNGPRPYHGTHVAGIIAANPGSGVSGIARGVPVMSVRASCQCDERDKDVANAIRYAVDNGANIISMSFGKAYSPQKLVVDSAVKYADAKGVLMVHAAGNGAADLAVRDNFPNARYLAGAMAGSWIEVGASSWRQADSLAYPSSNYGRDRVDVFAPGVDIYSTWLGGGYARLSGTSMAAPVVSGIAAVLMQYYAELSAADVKRVILASATKHGDQLVLRPGGKGEHIPFSMLSTTGGIANLYAAIKLAEREREDRR